MHSKNEKIILITGGAGFIGSNLVRYILTKYLNYRIINLDALTYSGDLKNLEGVIDDKSHIFIEGDICNIGLIKYIFKQYKIDGIIHLAAESHVDNSIKFPDKFIQTNVVGTNVLLQVANENWMINPFVVKKEKEHCRFHHVSTDEVFGSLGNDGYFSETTPYAPNSPYSSSKAASDFIVRSYNKTYGLNTVITNCSNNYGQYQHSEKFIPHVIKCILHNEIIPVYGDGKNIRDWLYVDDHCSGIDIVFHNGKSGQTYNIGGNNEYSNNEVVNMICEILDKKFKKTNENSSKKLITYVKDRPGHDKRYAIDSTKIQLELGWKIKTDFKKGLEKTIDYYINKFAS